RTLVPLRLPEPEAPDEGVLVADSPAPGGKLVELAGLAAPQHDVVGLDRLRQLLDRLEDRLLPLPLAVLLPPKPAHVILEGPLPKGQVAELQRLDDTVHDERRA